MTNEQLVHAYKIESAQVMRFHGDFARIARRVLKTPVHYVHGIISADVPLPEWSAAKDKLARNGVYVKDMAQYVDFRDSWLKPTLQ